MGTLDDQTNTPVGPVSRTGGSGGGPNPAVWTEPSPGHVFGLNSLVAFGGNIQIACPINFQMAFGSNLQVCINPSAFQTLYMDGGASFMPPKLNALLGGGMGGNMQLTMGTSANVVMGQIFDINLGPSRITLDVHTATAIQNGCKVLGTIIGVLSAVVLAVYCAPNDDVRAVTLLLYQVAMQTLLTLLMDLQGMYNRMDAAGKDAIDKAFGWDGKAETTRASQGIQATFGAPQNSWLAAIAVVLLLQGPFLMEAIGESMLDSQPASS
jgi:hypothetical protein